MRVKRAALWPTPKYKCFLSSEPVPPALSPRPIPNPPATMFPAHAGANQTFSPPSPIRTGSLLPSYS